MDMEKLTKSQIVLLTLLTSFVTSIATGIVAVTLMEQAPPAITQTVNRIVERTVEKVVPEAIGEVAGAAVVTERVVIREQDLVAEALKTVEPSVVRLFAPGRDESGKDIELFAGMAIVADAQGLLFADAATPQSQLTAVRSDGMRVPVTFVKSADAGSKSKILRLQAATTTKDEKDPTVERQLVWTPAKIALKVSSLGQSVVAIGGRGSTRLSAGIITAISEKSADDTGGQTVETNIPSDSFSAGSPLMGTTGEIIGMATRESRATGSAFLAFGSITWYDHEEKNEEPAAEAAN